MNTDAGNVVFENCPVCGNREFNGTPKCICSKRFDMNDYKSIILAARLELDKARMLFVSEKYVEADTACVRAYELWDGLFEEAIALRVRIAIETAQFDTAFKLLPSIENRESNQALAEKLQKAVVRDNGAKEHYNIALRNARRSENAYAIEELYSAIELAPYLIEPYRLLIKVLILLGDYDRAQTWFELAQQRFGTEPSISALKREVFGITTVRPKGIRYYLLAWDESPTIRLVTSVVLFSLVVASWLFAIFSGK